MNQTFRRFFWIFNLAAIAVCALFAASAATEWIAAQIPMSRSVKRKASAAMTAPIRRPQNRSVAKILERNVFCSMCKPEEAVVPTTPGPETEGDPTNEAVKTNLEVKLLATLVSDQDPMYSYAAIETDKKTRFYGVGHILMDKAKVVEIHDKRVIMINGRRREYLEFATKSSKSRSSSRGKPPRRPAKRNRANSPAWLKEGISEKGDGRFEIRRTALNKVLANTSLLARSARIVPSVRNGKPNGFRLYAIRPGSAYSLLGMKNGDTIHAVNGKPMNTPEQALQVYTQIRNASHLTISYTRRNKKKTHDYTIR
jgi:general secretion pathway protein C